MLRIADDPAVVTVGAASMAGSELLAASAALAARLHGAPAVAVHAAPGLGTVVAAVAALLAGVPLVPVPADAGALEAGHIVTDSGAALLVADEAPPWAAELATGGGAGRRLEVVPALGHPGGGPTEVPAHDGVAMVLYTSGTTGLPKGVPVTRSAITACIDGLAARWQWGPGEVTTHGLPLWHVHGLVLGVVGPLRLGGRVGHTMRPTPAAYAGAGGDVLFGVPTVWARVAADPAAARALRGARLLVSGSAALPAPVATALGDLAGQVPVERYGMTETLITLAAPAADHRRVGWVGPALPGIEARVLDDDRVPVAPDGQTVGDLEVRGPTVMAGYLGRPDATAEVLGAEGWLRTGDVATVDADGWHRVVGRRAIDLIKSGGYRIGAGEVEAALLGHPAVAEAAVVGEPDDDLGQVVVAYVVASAPVRAADLVTHVAAGLSAHKRPRRVHLVDELPKNAMGKVQKRLLAAGD
ncbi:MAG TPA: AMP-binding protein [Acidimicrobiales bacterium]|nr:AMP-binding protein [Acidimicrobiales bacterium]